MPAASAACAEHAQDADGALVGAALELQRGAQLLAVAAREHRDRAGVRHVRHHRAERDEPGDVLAQRDVDELRRERLPGAGGLDAGEQPQLRAARLARGLEERRLGPAERALALAVDGDLRTRVLVVEVQLGIDREDRLVVPAVAQMRDRGGRGFAGVVPSVERGDEHSASQSVHATSSARPRAPSRIGPAPQSGVGAHLGVPAGRDRRPRHAGGPAG